MARMWTCGFELQSTSAEFGVNSGVIVTGSPSISTTVHRAGTASLRINPTAATSFVEHQLTSGVVMRTTHRLYLRVDTLPSTATNVYGIGQSGYFPALLRLQTDGTLVLRDGFTETTLTGTSAALTLGRWYRIELDYNDVTGTLTSGVAAFKGYLDGVMFADTLCSNINGFSRIRMGVQLAATTDIYIDDVAVNDTTGSVQNGLPGPGSVVHLRPNAAGDANGWATAVGGAAGAANNYIRVNETPPNDATSYNQTTATGTTTIDDFNVEDRATAGIGSSDTITLVQVGGRVASDNTTAASIVYRLKGQASGTVQESASVTVANTSWSVHAGQSPRPYQLTAYVNPQGSAAWTPSALDGIQIGYRGDVSQTTVRRVSTLWALVEYVPATSAALTLASETDGGQSLGKAKRRALTLASETGTAQGLARRKTKALGTATETSSGQTLAGRKARTVGLAAETDAAQPLTGRRSRQLGTASETNTAQAPGRVRARALTLAAETGTAQALGRRKTIALGVAIETDTGQALARAKTRAVTTAADTETAQSLGRRKTAALGIATGAEAGQPLGRVRTTALGSAGETTAVQPLGKAKRQALDGAVHTETATTLVPASGLQPAVETDTAQPLARAKRRSLGTATESGDARALPQIKTRVLPLAAESATGLSLEGGKARALGSAQEALTALLLTGAKTRAVGVAGETASALSLARAKAGLLSVAEAVETARPVTGTLAATLDRASEVDSARPLARSKHLLLGTAVETTAARPVVAAKTVPLTAADEVDQAQHLTIPGQLLAAQETSTARPLGTGKTRSLTAAAESGTGLVLGARKQLLLGTALATETALTPGRAKARALGTVAGSDAALPLGAVKHRSLGPAAEISRALIGPKIRLTQAIDRHQALALVGHRQQPADHLDTSTSGPVLAPSTSGPDLTASSSGPQLAATTTTGG
jgi:hypothetical protein